MDIALVAALAASYVVLLVAALAASSVLFLASGLLVLALEVAVGPRAPFLGWVAHRVGVGASWRGLLRLLAAFVLLARSDPPAGWLLTAGICVVVLVGLRAAAQVTGGGPGPTTEDAGGHQRPVARAAANSIRSPSLGRSPPRRSPRPPRMSSSSCGAAVAVLAGALSVLQAGATVAAALLVAATGMLARSALAMRQVPGRRMLSTVDRTPPRRGAARSRSTRRRSGDPVPARDVDGDARAPAHTGRGDPAGPGESAPTRADPAPGPVRGAQHCPDGAARCRAFASRCTSRTPPATSTCCGAAAYGTCSSATGTATRA